MQKTKLSPVPVGELINQIHQGLSDRKGQSQWGGEHAGSQNSMNPHLLGITRLVHVKELLALHDLSFLIGSYQVLFGRIPSPHEYGPHLTLLRERKAEKIDILWSLYQSQERIQRRSPLVHVTRAYHIHRLVTRLGNLFLVGRLFRWAFAIAELPRLAWKLKLAEVQLHAKSTDLALFQENQKILLENLIQKIQDSLRTPGVESAIEGGRPGGLAGVDEIASKLKQIKEYVFLVNHIVRVEIPQKQLISEAHFEGLDEALKKLQSGFSAIEISLREQEGALREQEGALREQEGALREQEGALQGHLESQNRLASDVSSQLDSFQQLSKNFSDAFDLLMSINHTVRIQAPEKENQLERRLGELDARMQAIQSQMADNLAMLLSVNHLTQVEIPEKENRLNHKILDQRYAIIDLERRFAQIQQPAAPLAAADSLKQEEWHEGLYLSFEDRHRGTREEIKRRLIPYLPILDGLGISKESEVIDLGCGRGEWLEILGDNGWKARGCDSNAHMVAACVDLGLSAERRHLMEFIRGQKSRSTGVISAFHVVEHLPHSVLIDLLNECLRVLKPGGCILFETPNPENLVVGATNFWIDPTHQRPLLPDGLKFLVESRGFEDCQIHRLNPVPSEEHYPGISRDPLLTNLVYCARDFAVIARKGTMSAAGNK